MHKRWIGLLVTIVGIHSSVLADSATWSTNPVSGDWMVSTNWVPMSVPNGPNDVATFETSAVTSLLVSSITSGQVSGIRFHEGADSFIFRVREIAGEQAFFLTISGSGLVNESGASQFFISETSGGVGLGGISFTNNSTAGDLVFFENHGALFRDVNPLWVAGVAFADTASAGTATFTNGAVPKDANPGFVSFEDNATAAGGSFHNLGAAEPPNQFFNAGFTDFRENSTAGYATFGNEGGLSTNTIGGATTFRDSSTAATSTITNFPGPIMDSAGGGTYFFDAATADHSTITNNGASYSGAYGGFLKFRNASKAGFSTITNESGLGDFGEGITIFADESTADYSTINNNGAPTVGQSGGRLYFQNHASAGRSNVRNVPGTGGNGLGGSIWFQDESSAGSAFLSVWAGEIFFIDDSRGDTAFIDLIGDSTRLNIDAHNPPGLILGALGGDGEVFLGSNSLTIGYGDWDTHFFGTIHGTGSLTKIGLGECSLGGHNVYSGVTTVNGGSLELSGSIASDVTVNNGGTVGTYYSGFGSAHSVTIHSGGSVDIKTDTHLQVNGDYVQDANTVLKIQVHYPVPTPALLDISGNATLAGTLEVRFHYSVLPQAGQTFELFHVGGTSSGSFSQIIFPDLRNGFQYQNEFVDGTYRITALNDGTAAAGFLNISTRMQIGAGDNALIGGFILPPKGNELKRVIVRAISSSLMVGGTPLPGRLADPTLELYDSKGTLLFSNDNWRESPQAQEIIESGIPPTDDNEAAIVASLDYGNYTAVMRGVNNTTGIGLVEIYDLTPSVPMKLANISTRGLVQTGDDVMIGGFIADNQAMHVIVRALGPSLGQSGIPNALSDPTLELHDGQGSVIAFNDDWQETNQAAIQNTGIAPTDPKESAIVATLLPGPYTAIVRGMNNTTGVGLVEVYDLP